MEGTKKYKWGSMWEYICPCGFHMEVDGVCDCDSCKSIAAKHTLPLKKCPKCGKLFKDVSNVPG